MLRAPPTLAPLKCGAKKEEPYPLNLAVMGTRDAAKRAEGFNLPITRIIGVMNAG